MQTRFITLMRHILEPCEYMRSIERPPRDITAIFWLDVRIVMHTLFADMCIHITVIHHVYAHIYIEISICKLHTQQAQISSLPASPALHFKMVNTRYGSILIFCFDFNFWCFHFVSIQLSKFRFSILDFFIFSRTKYKTVRVHNITMHFYNNNMHQLFID